MCVTKATLLQDTFFSTKKSCVFENKIPQTELAQEETGLMCLKTTSEWPRKGPTTAYHNSARHIHTQQIFPYPLLIKHKSILRDNKPHSTTWRRTYGLDIPQSPFPQHKPHRLACHTQMIWTTHITRMCSAPTIRIYQACARHDEPPEKKKYQSMNTANPPRSLPGHQHHRDNTIVQHTNK